VSERRADCEVSDREGLAAGDSPARVGQEAAVCG